MDSERDRSKNRTYSVRVRRVVTAAQPGPCERVERARARQRWFDSLQCSTQEDHEAEAE